MFFGEAGSGGESTFGSSVGSWNGLFTTNLNWADSFGRGILGDTTPTSITTSSSII